MKKILYSINLFIMVALFAACSSNSPSGVLEDYLSAMKEGKYEKMVDKMAFKKELSESDRESLINMLKEKGEKSKEKEQGIKEYKILEEIIDEGDTTATVKFEIAYNSGRTDESEQKMIKRDGKWLLKSGK